MNDSNDRTEIIAVSGDYATGLDARDWRLWRSVFTDEVSFDLSTWNGIAPRPLEADRVVAVQARIFAEFSATQHFFTNHRVFVEGDRARLLMHMRAEHWLADPGIEGTDRYTMFGYYDDRLVRTASGWKICEMQLNVTRTEGNRWVMEEAQRRARARRDRQKRSDRTKPPIATLNETRTLQRTDTLVSVAGSHRGARGRSAGFRSDIQPGHRACSHARCWNSVPVQATTRSF